MKVLEGHGEALCPWLFLDPVNQEDVEETAVII